MQQAQSELTNSVTALKIDKLDATIYQREISKLDKSLNEVKARVEDNTNHFAMIENFVEKYLPIRIQNQLSEVFKSILPFDIKTKYLKYEKNKTLELN